MEKSRCSCRLISFLDQSLRNAGDRDIILCLGPGNGEETYVAPKVHPRLPIRAHFQILQRHSLEDEKMRHSWCIFDRVYCRTLKPIHLFDHRSRGMDNGVRVGCPFVLISHQFSEYYKRPANSGT